MEFLEKIQRNFCVAKITDSRNEEFALSYILVEVLHDMFFSIQSLLIIVVFSTGQIEFQKKKNRDCNQGDRIYN